MLKILLIIKWFYDFIKFLCIEFFIVGYYNCGNSSICVGNLVVWGIKFLNFLIYLFY